MFHSIRSAITALFSVGAGLALSVSGVGVAEASPAPTIGGSVSTGVTVPANFRITGSGYGHGVGMSQYGAQQMSLNGWDAKKILEYYYNPAQLVYTGDYADSSIRVQLSSATTQKITPVNGTLSIKSGRTVFTTSSAVDMKIINGSRYYTIDGKAIRSSASFDTLTWSNTVKVDKANANSAPVNYKYGYMRISTIGSNINVSNVLKLNTEYLYGLGEMPASWSASALQAQAIAGRTYAMRNLSTVKSDCDCNVYDEVKSQKFLGNDVVTGWKGANWKAAVDSTVRYSNGKLFSGGVMKYNGSLIDALYSSSTNGKTQAAKDMWGSNITYLQSRNDPYSTTSINPNAKWTVDVPQAKLNSAFGLSNITSLSVTYNSSGYAKTVTATSKTGTKKSITGTAFRSALGLKSTGITNITKL